LSPSSKDPNEVKHEFDWLVRMILLLAACEVIPVDLDIEIETDPVFHFRTVNLVFRTPEQDVSLGLTKRIDVRTLRSRVNGLVDDIEDFVMMKSL